jgi:hypothetical protein
LGLQKETSCRHAASPATHGKHWPLLLPPPPQLQHSLRRQVLAQAGQQQIGQQQQGHRQMAALEAQHLQLRQEAGACQQLLVRPRPVPPLPLVMDQYLPLVVTAQQLRMRAVAPQMQQQLEAAAQQLVLARQMALAHTTLQQQQAQGASLREMLHHGHMSRVTCMLSW